MYSRCSTDPDPDSRIPWQRPFILYPDGYKSYYSARLLVLLMTGIFTSFCFCFFCSYHQGSLFFFTAHNKAFVSPLLLFKRKSNGTYNRHLINSAAMNVFLTFSVRLALKISHKCLGSHFLVLNMQFLHISVGGAQGASVGSILLSSWYSDHFAFIQFSFSSTLFFLKKTALYSSQRSKEAAHLNPFSLSIFLYLIHRLALV